MVHTCNLSTQEAESGESRIWGQPGLHSEALSQKRFVHVGVIQIKMFVLTKMEPMSSGSKQGNS
jgi:hypothetical protein